MVAIVWKKNNLYLCSCPCNCNVPVVEMLQAMNCRHSHITISSSYMFLSNSVDICCQLETSLFSIITLCAKQCRSEYRSWDSSEKQTWLRSILSIYLSGEFSGRTLMLLLPLLVVALLKFMACCSRRHFEGCLKYFDIREPLGGIWGKICWGILASFDIGQASSRWHSDGNLI